MNNVIFLSGLYSHQIKPVMRPISCYQLAWWLRKHGIDSQIIDFTQLMSGSDITKLIDLCIDETTHTLAITTVFWNTEPTPIIPPQIKHAVEYVREKYPNICVVGGGNNIGRFDPEKLFFDVHIMGDGEDSLLEYCFKKTPGKAISFKNFNIIECDHRFSRKDLLLEHEAIPMELGRGCIFKCKFCSSLNLGKPKGTYQRNYNYVFDEIKYNYENFGVTHYMFLDDTVNEDPEKIEFIAGISKRLGVQITWGGYIRVDLVWSHKNHDMLYESGLRNAYFGLESFHPEASLAIGKGWNGKHGKEWIPELYNNLWGGKVGMEGSFIVGLPKENIESLWETAEWIKQLGHSTLFFYALDLKHDTKNTNLSSVFSREYPKYNYTIKDGKWNNTVTGFNREMAVKIAADLNKYVKENSVPTVGGWTANHLYNVGMSIDDVRKTPLSKVGGILNSKAPIFLQRYIEKFTKLYT